MQVTTPRSDGYIGTLPTSYSWTCQQNNANNAYYVTIPSANVNNNNKNNTYAVVPVAEFEKLNDLLFGAEGDCWRNKKKRFDAVRFHYNLKTIFELSDKIAVGKYRPTTSICFVLDYPRYREVFAAKYIDRVIHHLVAPFILSVTESVHSMNGNISHGNRKKLSAHTAALQIQSNMRHYPNGYVATMDVSGFFMNIDREKAFNIFIKFFEKYRPTPFAPWYVDLMLRLLKILIMHDPTSDCIRNSPISAWRFIAANKTLFGNDGKGLPIGNFYSQLIANLVLAVWGMAILEMHLDCRITQFVDDMCVVAADAETITKVRKRSAEVLRSIGLVLHPRKYYIQPIRHGVQFCGRVIYADRIYTCNRTIRACKKTIKDAIKSCSLENAYRLQSSFNSYIGMMCHSRSFNIQQQLMQLVMESDYAKWVYFKNEGGHLVLRIKDEFKAINVRVKELHEMTKQQKQFEYERKSKHRTEQRSTQSGVAERNPIPLRF